MSSLQAMGPKYQGKKRAAPHSTQPVKKRKLLNGKAAPAHLSKKQKVKTVVEIPDVASGSDSGVEEEDFAFFQSHSRAGEFLHTLDKTAIARSKGETNRLRKLANADYRRVYQEDDLPSISSHSGDESEWSSALGDEVDSAEEGSNATPPLADSDEEQPYEVQPRTQTITKAVHKTNRKVIPRLPIKLANGLIEKTGEREGTVEEPTTSDTSGGEEKQEKSPPRPRNDVATGARFGRPAIVDILTTKSRKLRVQAAKEQIAGICQDIIAEPENGLGLLRRILSFASVSITTTDSSGNSTALSNDPIVRELAIFSLLAVFKDIVPGYRIRKLTEKEMAENVSQMVGRTREWEQGLVGIYQSYLQLLDGEIKGKTDLAQASIGCMCTLLKELTHFNFRTNLMSTVIAQLSRKSWDKISDICLDAIVHVFANDLTGAPSLEAVRLLNRMIKERRYQVHPNVLSCLLYLRLKTELGDVRASTSKAEKEGEGRKNKFSARKAKELRAKGKGKKAEGQGQAHLSKKAKKAKKELKDIQEEMEEAEAEVDSEERATQHTETLKLLFVLYFSILKAPSRTRLLSAALHGVSKFAHLVNIDFFKDILGVLKDIIMNAGAEGSIEEDKEVESQIDTDERLRLQLHCIVTAYELLTGQGEALNLELDDFTNHLYKIIPHLGLSLTLEDAPSTVTPNNARQLTFRQHSTSQLLFRALTLILTPKHGRPPLYLLAAFGKRLLGLSLHVPPKTSVLAIDFVQSLLAVDEKLDVMLSTEEVHGGIDGIYREDIDDPRLCNPLGCIWWELASLEDRHWDPEVRRAAARLRTLQAEPGGLVA